MGSLRGATNKMVPLLLLLTSVIAQAQYGGYGLGGRGNYGPGGQGDYGVGFGEYGQDNGQGQDYGKGSSDELAPCRTKSKHGRPCTTGWRQKYPGRCCAGECVRMRKWTKRGCMKPVTDDRMAKLPTNRFRF